jgi:hypothetical protein
LERPENGDLRAEDARHRGLNGLRIAHKALRAVGFREVLNPSLASIPSLERKCDASLDWLAVFMHDAFDMSKRIACTIAQGQSVSAHTV